MATQPIVDANYRFIAASQEINTRIAQRQQALALYVTLTVGLLATFVALKSSDAHTLLPVEWLVLGFPISSTCLVLLNYKAERAISNLRNFLSELERLSDAHQILPSYNTDPKWAKAANEARRFHIYAAAILVAGANIIGLGATMAIYPERVAANPLAIWVSAIIAILSFVALLFTLKWSYKPLVQEVVQVHIQP